MNARLGYCVMTLLCGCAPIAAPYGAPPETSDPWVLIRHAREWLGAGRPRGALPSLQQAERLVDPQLTDGAARAHARAAIHNERGRAYELLSDLPRAEQSFITALDYAAQVPDYLPLQLDLHYNLSTVYERQARPAQSCDHLRTAFTLSERTLADPREPPYGYGAKTQAVVVEMALPRMRAKAARIDCTLAE